MPVTAASSSSSRPRLGRTVGPTVSIIGRLLFREASERAAASDGLLGCWTFRGETSALRMRGTSASELRAALALASREIWNVIMAVLLETTLGDIVIDLFTEERPKSKTRRRFTGSRKLSFGVIGARMSDLLPGL